MLRVGLTGSIAVGKTFVCEVFRELGVAVLDADQTAREVVEPNTIGLNRIIEAFGSGILQPNGELDRLKLGAIVFADSAKRETLNSIIHPLVFEAQDLWLRDLEKKGVDKFAIIDAALMIESNGYQRFDKIIVVWCDAEIQIERLMNRNKLNREEAIIRINTQMSQTEKKKFGDYLIDSSDGFDSVRRQVFEVFGELSIL
jgi:dephospho-CoA kinase